MLSTVIAKIHNQKRLSVDETTHPALMYSYVGELGLAMPDKCIDYNYYKWMGNELNGQLHDASATGCYSTNAAGAATFWHSE